MLDGLAKVVRQALLSEEIAARDGLLQRFDARAKLLGVLALLLATGLVRHIPVLLASTRSLSFWPPRRGSGWAGSSGGSGSSSRSSPGDRGAGDVQLRHAR